MSGQESSPKFCAFLDVLGFKGAVQSRPRTAEAWLDKTIHAAMKVAQAQPSVEVFQGSDSTFIFAPESSAKEFAEALALFQREVFTGGVPVRGGAAFGPVADDPRTHGLTNYDGRKFFGQAVSEAVLEEGRLKGMRISLTESCAERLPTGSTQTNSHGRELRWVLPQHETQYVEFLVEKLMETFGEDPRAALHYVDTLCFIVREASDSRPVVAAIDEFAPHFVLPPEAPRLWTECFAWAWKNQQFKLFQRDAIRKLLSSSVGRDWLTDLVTAPAEVRKAVIAAAM